jgi:UDP-3-O-[3-hydroxymyristoyl] N-acetylglucosamine deacetylase
MGVLMQPTRYTLAETVSRSGVGLHTGEQTQVSLLPVPAGDRYFVRVDLPGKPEIPATLASVRQTQLATQLVGQGATVQTVEHLLAALAVLGITDVCIEVNGPEIPLLDGSAQDWTEAIAGAGKVAIAAPARELPGVSQPICLYQGDAFVAAIPAEETRFTYGIDFPVAPIGNQWYSWAASADTWAAEIAPARTFTLEAYVEPLRQQGWIRGGSLDNALVCGDRDWLNPPLRFANEPVRHKILDFVGDVSLLGFFPKAHFIAYKASHQLHVRLARQIASVPQPCPSTGE